MKKIFFKLGVFINDLKNLNLSLLYDLFPRNKKIWLFGAWFGETYNDNSKYLFEYIIKNNKHIKPVWITKELKVYNLLKQKGYPVYLNNSLMAKYYKLRAYISIVCTTCKDTFNCPDKKIKFINLWHGTPLKRIMYDNENCDKKNYSKKEEIKNFYRKIFRKEIDYKKMMFIATSKEVQKKISSAFRVNIENVKITGYPRNDAFYIEENSQLRDIVFKLKKDNKHLLIYMPTYRSWGDFNVGKFLNNNLEYINNELSKTNSFMFIKLHHGDMNYIKKSHLNKFENILFVDNEMINFDIYPLLQYIDILITDYSSIYFDFLLLNKPIIFAPFDIKEYNENFRNFYYEYEKVTPGHKIYSWKELFKILPFIINGDDKYKEERIKINKIFNNFVDNRNSERVFKEIIRQYY